MSVNSSELQEMIDLAKEDLIKTKADVEATQKANDNAADAAASAQTARDNELNKLEQLKSQAVQARVDGKIELADRLDIQVEQSSEIFKQLSDIAQEKWNASQYAVDDLLWAQEFYDAAQINLRTLQEQQNSSGGNNPTTPQTNNSGSTRNEAPTNTSGINPGDKIQIRVGSIDVTNGVTAQSGGMYVEGGALWATVEYVDPEWSTGGRWGLSETVVKVRCKGADGQTVVWQVTPDNIAPNIIKVNIATQSSPTPPKPQVELTSAGQTDLNVAEYEIAKDPDVQSVIPYTTKVKGLSWAEGIATKDCTTGQLSSPSAVKTQVSSGSCMDGSTVFKY